MSARQAFEQQIPVPTADAPELASDHGVSVSTVRVKLWDLPMRVFHWSLLAAVATAITTGKLGGDWMEVHGKAGITIAGLLAFRLVWGFVGPTPARFASFLPSPGALLAYVQGRWRGIGHNPLGALSVIALLGVLGAQAVTGLFSNDDIAFAGPWALRVAEELSSKLTRWHHQLVNVIFLLLGLHVAAIAFYSWFKRDKLVRPMVTGWKEVPADLPAPRRASPAAFVFALLVGIGAAYAASGAWPKPAVGVPDTGTPTAADLSQPATAVAKTEAATTPPNSAPATPAPAVTSKPTATSAW